MIWFFIWQLIHILIISCFFFLVMSRCQASAVAVSVAIAMMLQKKERHFNKTGGYNIPAIIQDSYDIAVKFIEIEEQVGILLYFIKPLI